MPLTPPEFLEYSRYLQHGVEPESRSPEGLQELLGSGLFWGNPERGPTLGLAWYSLGEPLLVDSAAALQETWAGPTPPPPPNTWGLGANLFVTVTVTRWRPEGERFAIEDVSLVELGFAHLPLVTSTGSFLLGPHELRLPVRTLIEHLEAELRSALEGLRARLDAAGVSEPSQLEELLPELLGEPCRFEAAVRVTSR